MRVQITALLMLLSMACASPPPPPESPDLSVIGARVRITRAVLGPQRTDYAYFVRLEEAGELPFAGELIRSNFAKDGYAFLFNAPPGRYAVISAGYFVETEGSAMTSVGGGISVGPGLSLHSTINIYLPETSIEKTTVSVESGEWAFLGDVVLDRVDWEQADEAQRRYSERLVPGYQDMNILEKAFKVGRHDPGTERSLDRSDAGLASFMETSREIAGEEWAHTLRSPVAAAPSED